MNLKALLLPACLLLMASCEKEEASKSRVDLLTRTEWVETSSTTTFTNSSTGAEQTEDLSYLTVGSTLKFDKPDGFTARVPNPGAASPTPSMPPAITETLRGTWELNQDQTTVVWATNPRMIVPGPPTPYNIVELTESSLKLNRVSTGGVTRTVYLQTYRAR